MGQSRTAEERFWSKVDKDGPIPEHRPDLGPCWLWQTDWVTNGYSYIQADGQQRLVHRFAYELLVGPIPEGLHVDHLCRVRHCVRGSHLEPVTQAENNRRAWAVNRGTHCVNGHERSPENTGSNGRWRLCKPCNRAKVQRATAARKAALNVEVERVCPECDATFSALQWQTQVYCGRSCGGRAGRRRKVAA